MKDLYVDDCLSGENMCEDVQSTTEKLKLVLEKGGFTLKAFTISGSDPSENLSKDGKSFISINHNELCFAQKFVGAILSNIHGVIPDNLTMHDCVGKVAEVFAPLVGSPHLSAA